MSEELRTLLTQDELMERLKISRPTLWRWRKAGLPSITVGRSVRFDPLEVDQWIKGHANTGVQAVPSEDDI